MPALKDKALTLLGSAVIHMQTADGAQAVFTTPVGKVARISHIVVRDSTGSLAGCTDVKFGTGFRNNAAVDLSSMTGGATDYMVLINATAAGADQKCTEIAAATAFTFTPTTGATADVDATIDVFGYTT